MHFVALKTVDIWSGTAQLCQVCARALTIDLHKTPMSDQRVIGAEAGLRLGWARGCLPLLDTVGVLLLS